jgi:DUF971 family protein
MSETAWPVRLTFQRGAARLAVVFDDGGEGDVCYKTLRENSPSAAVRGHGSGPPPIQAPVPDDISVTKAELVGRYAVRVHFSDGHSSGLYTWALLRRLCIARAASGPIG